MAEQLLAADVQDAEDAVNSNVSATLTQTQFDALVSFVYNVGAGAFSRGSVPEKLNAGNFDAALATMRLYYKSNGVISASLVARRADEIGQFLA
jgi:lysozyme